MREEVRGLYVESSGLKSDIAQVGKQVEGLDAQSGQLPPQLRDRGGGGHRAASGAGGLDVSRPRVVKHRSEEREQRATNSRKV